MIFPILIKLLKYLIHIYMYNFLAFPELYCIIQLIIQYFSFNFRLMIENKIK